MKYITLIIICIIALSIDFANADSLDVNLTSWHSDREYDYNQNNFGLGYTKTFDHHWSGKIGFYDNSYYKTSTYALLSLNHRMSNWSFGIDAGFVTGYNNIRKFTLAEVCESDGHDCETVTESNGVKNLDKYQFVIYPTGTWHINKRHALTGGMIPAIDSKSATVVGIQYRWTI